MCIETSRIFEAQEFIEQEIATLKFESLMNLDSFPDQQTLDTYTGGVLLILRRALDRVMTHRDSIDAVRAIAASLAREVPESAMPVGQARDKSGKEKTRSVAADRELNSQTRGQD
jgi:hypothetical protein